MYRLPSKCQILKHQNFFLFSFFLLKQMSAVLSLLMCQDCQHTVKFSDEPPPTHTHTCQQRGNFAELLSTLTWCQSRTLKGRGRGMPFCAMFFLTCFTVQGSLASCRHRDSQSSGEGRVRIFSLRLNLAQEDSGDHRKDYFGAVVGKSRCSFFFLLPVRVLSSYFL